MGNNFSSPSVKLKTPEITNLSSSNHQVSILKNEEDIDPLHQTLSKQIKIFRHSMNSYISSTIEEITYTSDLCDEVDTSDLDTYIMLNSSNNNVQYNDDNNLTNTVTNMTTNNILIKRSNPVSIPNPESHIKMIKPIKQKIIDGIETEIIPCTGCKKSVVRIKDDYTELYCSAECYYNNYNKSEAFECQYCGNLFMRNRLDKYKTFCNDSCLEKGRYLIRITCIDCGMSFHLALKHQYKIYRCDKCQSHFLSYDK